MNSKKKYSATYDSPVHHSDHCSRTHGHRSVLDGDTCCQLHTRVLHVHNVELKQQIQTSKPQ